MQSYQLDIFTSVDGVDSHFSTNCECIEEKGAYLISYRQDEDDVLIKAVQNRLIMKRKGVLDMTFLPQEQTIAVVKVEQNQGQIPIYTSQYSIKATKIGVKIHLCYQLQFPQFSQNFSLNLFIKK